MNSWITWLDGQYLPFLVVDYLGVVHEVIRKGQAIKQEDIPFAGLLVAEHGVCFGGVLVWIWYGWLGWLDIFAVLKRWNRNDV